MEGTVSGTLMKNYDRKSKIFVKREIFMNWKEKKNIAKGEVDHGIH